MVIAKPDLAHATWSGLLLIRVYYEDTDCSAVVYYANYLRFFERARTEFLRERGMEVARFAEAGIFFVGAHVEGRAKLVCIDLSGKPRRLPEELHKALEQAGH